MGDWVGLAFFVILVIAVYFGLRALSKPSVKTEEEFERGASEGKTLLGVGVEAINGLLHPGAARGKNTVEQLRKGTYNKKKQEGGTIGNPGNEEND